MSTIDASQCWRIMPFDRFEGGEDWWVLGPDHQPVDGGIVPTKEEAFAMALEHNKPYGVDAVYVHGPGCKNGKWEEPPAETSDDEYGILEQMDKDFEDYKEKMAQGAYTEAEDVEEDVRKMKEVNPDAPEENLRKLAVSYIAAKKRIRQWRRETVTEDLAEPMIKKLFSGNLECVDSLPPIPTLDEDEEETERRVHELEQHEKAIIKQHGKYDQLAKRQKEQEQ